MRLFTVDRDNPQDPLVGPWNSALSCALRLAHALHEEPHYHQQMREVCVVIAGTAELVVGGRIQIVETGAAAVIEPGEVHSWRSTGREFRMVVVHEPWLPDDTSTVMQV